MAEHEPQQQRGRTPPVRRTVPVVRVQQITPLVRRITFSGPEMADFSLVGPAENMKIYFPAPGEERPFVPVWGTPPAQGQPRPIARTYTPRRWRPDALELDIDFVLHGEGPGDTWAQSVAAGRLATLSSPKGAYTLDANTTRYLIAGDSVALPAIGTLLEALPAKARAQIYVEVEGESEEQELTSDASIQIVWLHRGQKVPGELLEDAIRAVALLDPEDRVFVACEASAMRGIRRCLLDERHLGRHQIYTHGYWKHGTANHSDSDRGEEI